MDVTDNQDNVCLAMRKVLVIAASHGGVEEHGGEAIVQDPQEAMAPEMPPAAIAADYPDACLPLNAIPERVHDLCEAR